MRYLRRIGRSVMLAIFVIGLVLSPNVWMAGKVIALRGEGMIAEYRLQMIPPEQYAAEIRSALDAGDGDLARSLLALAQQRQVAVPDELVQRVAALPAVDLGNVLGQGWNCVVNGDFDSEAGFACVIATDVTGIGDVRDLVGQGTNYLTGQPVNYLTLGLATVGLGLSVSTYMSLGGTLPLRAGASFVKSMYRLGKLPPKLVAEVGGALARGINGKAVEESVTLARELRLGEIGAPLGRVFNPRSVAMLTDLATDFGQIGKAGGVRAMKLSAEAADTTRDVKVLAKTAERYEDGYLGVMKMLGKGVLRLGDLVLTLGAWFIGAAFWVWSMLWFMLRTTTRGAHLTARLIYRLLRPARAVGA